MKYFIAVGWLVVNFIKSAIYSGFDTARLILFMPKNLKSGLRTIPYQDLEGYPLSILGMMITLTPGTTLIDIDTENQTLVLHLLDIKDQDKILKQIQHDYIVHLNQWSKPNHDAIS